MCAPLIFVVGASGSGKDSLLDYARHRLAADAGICFAHRYITRSADAGGENHVALSDAEFANRSQAGLFALEWHSHGLRYGIGIEIDQWLARGMTVVLNGSRHHLLQARARYPQLVPIHIEVPEALLRQRLLARGRETPAQIEQRLQRRLTEPAPAAGQHVIRNDSSLDTAGEQLVQKIRQSSGDCPCA